MTSARAIIEAEDPKSVFRALLQGPAFGYVDRVLGNSGWNRLGANQHGWRTKYEDYREAQARGTRNGPTRQRYVWWDDVQKEWVMKLEGEKWQFGRWCGNHELGVRVFKNGADLIRAIREQHYLREAEDPKHFLRTLGTGEHIRTKGDLRRYIAAQIRTLPVRDSDHTSDRDELLTWYRTLDQRVMPKIIKALERFYGVSAPDGTSGLFRTWIKNSQTERRAAQILAGFEGIIEDE